MKVSVITAVRNASAHIERTLQSVATQRYSDIEHIVVDGASTDDTLARVKRFVPSVSRWISEPDRGVYDALNKGLAMATGEVVGFLHAGDVFCSDQSIKQLVDTFETNHCDAVYGDVRMTSPTDSAKVVRHYQARSFRPSRLAYGFSVPHPALYVRRSTYQQIGGYDPRFVIAGDFEFCIRLFLKHAVSTAHLPYFVVDMPEGGLSSKNLWTILWINTREMRDACHRHGVKTSWWRLYSRLVHKWWSGRLG